MTEEAGSTTGSSGTPRVAIAHDYLTQRGGAERVVLAMTRAFPGAPVYTSLFRPEATFADFATLDVRTSAIDRVGLFQRHHRLALPVLAPAVSRLQVDADVVLCSSSGWAHGVRTEGHKIVYCYTPARWLYVDGQAVTRGRARLLGDAALGVLRAPLRRWDRKAAAAADRYLTLSSETARRIRSVYGIDAEVLPPPVAIAGDGPQQPVTGIEPGYHLVVARLMPYKHVDVVVEAFASLPERRLVVVGTGPAAADVRRALGANVVLEQVSEAELRWLYAHAAALVSAAHEDFGLTPLEAATFGTPSIVRKVGGFVETVVEDETGVFFGELTPRAITDAVARADRQEWDRARLQRHAAQFGEERFGARLRTIVQEVRADAG
jgi:glycosyltransferase involved in cell wall biosynthesis